MQKLYGEKTGSISLEREIASGGEGVVWETHLNNCVAKIYKHPDFNRRRKLEIMIDNPPGNPTSHLNHTSIAWPQELLRDQEGNFVGFLMPKIQKSKVLFSVYNPKKRKKEAPLFNWQYLHTAAKNLAWIIKEIHAKGYILGDIKPENILVNERALISVIDTDSFQVRDPKHSNLYRCNVASVGLTPPELLGKSIPDIAQTKSHDYFRLGIVIYFLLFGSHPFSGEWHGSGPTPAQDECIKNCLWPYSSIRNEMQAAYHTIPLEIVHPDIKNCFLKCFNEGHINSNLRPSAADWYKALETGISDLVKCSQVDNHIYSKQYESSYGQCYWCHRAQVVGVDIFATSLTKTSKKSSPTPKAATKAKPSAKRYTATTKTTSTVPKKTTSQESRSGFIGCILLILFILFILFVIAS